MKVLNSPEECWQYAADLLATGLFEKTAVPFPPGVTSTALRLIGTEWLIVTSQQKFWEHVRWRKEKVYQRFSFEEIFESLPEDLQIKLLYHLDLVA